MGPELIAGEFPDITAGDGGGDEVAQGVGGIVAAETVVVDVDLEDIGGVVGVVLQIGEGVEEAVAAFMDEELGREAGLGVAEALLDFGQALDPVGVGGADGNTEVGELGRERAAIGPGAKEVAPRGDLAEAPGVGGIEAHAHAGGFADGGSARVADKEPVALAHFLDGGRVALRDPAPLGVFIHDEQVVVVITAPEEDDGVMSDPRGSRCWICRPCAGGGT